MPAYNAETTVRLAVSSTLRAMPRDSELLVLDDKSTDNTLGVLESIRDPRLRILVADQNFGGPASRRRLLAESDSEILASIDADDVTLPWRFSQQEKALEFADVIFSSAIRFDSAKESASKVWAQLPRAMRIRPSSTVPIQPGEFPSALLFHNPVWHPSLFARRSAIERVGGYNESRHGADDWELWLRMAKSGIRMYRMALPVIGYRESPNQASRSPEHWAAVRGDSALRCSYVELFNAMTKSVYLCDEPRPLEKIAETVRTGLKEQLPLLRTINRLHYLHIIQQNRIHFVLSMFPVGDSLR